MFLQFLFEARTKTRNGTRNAATSSSTIFNDTEIILLFLEIYILYIVLFVSYVINCTFSHPLQVHGQLMIGLVVSVQVISILVPLMGQFTAQVPCHSADTPATFLYHSCLQKQAYISALWLIETGCWTYNYIFTTVAVAVITVACRQKAMALYFYSSIWWTFYTFRTIVWCKIIVKNIALDKARTQLTCSTGVHLNCAFTAWKFVIHLNTLFSHWSIQASKVPCSPAVYLMKLWWRRSALGRLFENDPYNLKGPCSKESSTLFSPRPSWSGLS